MGGSVNLHRDNMGFGACQNFSVRLFWLKMLSSRCKTGEELVHEFKKLQTLKDNIPVGFLLFVSQIVMKKT